MHVQWRYVGVGASRLKQNVGELAGDWSIAKMAGWPTIREREREWERERERERERVWGEGSSSSVHRRKHILTSGLHKPKIRLFVIPTHTLTQSLIQWCTQMFYACQCALEKCFRLNVIFFGLWICSLSISLCPCTLPPLYPFIKLLCVIVLFFHPIMSSSSSLKEFSERGLEI